MAKSYWEKLRDPRWQKKRLEIMERAGFMCDQCGNVEKTLHVHHGYYEKGMDPWEYRDDTLWCLCEECHQEISDVTRDLYLEIAKSGPSRIADILMYVSAGNDYDKHMAKEDEKPCA